jgi:hypothetical protein
VDSRHDLTTLLLALRSWGTLVVPKSTSSGWDIPVFERKLRAQAKSLKIKRVNLLVLLESVEHKRDNLSFGLVRKKSRAQADCPPSALFRRENTRLLARKVRNPSKLTAVKHSARFRDDLAECVKTRVKTSKRGQNAGLEVPIINRLLARKSLIPKGLEVALHGCCTRGSSLA